MRPSQVPTSHLSVVQNVYAWSLISLNAHLTFNFLSQQLLRDDPDYPTGDAVFKLIREGTAGAAGMPIGVQMAGRPFQEELVLNVMGQLEVLRGPFRME